MRVKYHILPSVLLLVLVVSGLAGCNRHPAQTSQALNSPNQSSATQPPPNQAPTDATSADNGNSASQPANASPSGGQENDSRATTTIPGDNAQVASGAPDVPYQPAESLIIPAGTPVTVRLQQNLSSASAVPGERFDAVLDAPIVVQDRVVVPVGTMVTGHVVTARRSGRFHHPGIIGLTLDSAIIGQQRVRLVTSSVVAQGGSHKKRNFGWIGGGTGGGALIGALAGGGKGALIGGGIGAAAGTTAALLTGKKDVTFSSERRLQFRLHRDVSVQG